MLVGLIKPHCLPAVSQRAVSCQAHIAAFGIDLGTTNSAISVIEPGQKPRVLLSPSGQATIPSVVQFLEPSAATEAVVVGEEARRAAARLPGASFYSVKRFIGQKYADTAADARQVAFAVEPGEAGDVCFPCAAVAEGRLYPEEVSAQVLRVLLDVAARHTGSPIDKAVISVPAYFDRFQREATERAGILAGLQVVRLIREPVAAALAYGMDVRQDRGVLVLDLGGGTFDVSLLEVGQGSFEVLSTGGDSHLGGDDWDNAIIKWIGDTQLTPAGIKWRTPRMVARLKAVAEAAKVKLTTTQKVAIRLPFQNKQGEPIETVLTRGKLEQMAQPLYRRMREAIDAACWGAGVDLEEVRALQARNAKSRQPEPVSLQLEGRVPISEVLLVGGATRMPGVRQLVTNMTGLDAKVSLIDPDQAVALGAAVQAGIYEGILGNAGVVDVWQAALGRALAQQHLQDDDEEYSDEDSDLD